MWPNRKFWLPLSQRDLDQLAEPEERERRRSEAERDKVQSEAPAPVLVDSSDDERDKEITGQRIVAPNSDEDTEVNQAACRSGLRTYAFVRRELLPRSMKE